MRLLKLCVIAVLAGLAVIPAAPAAARLGPAPVVADCLVYRGPAPCIYNIGFIEARLSRHILHVGDTLTADYSWGLSPTRGATPLTVGAVAFQAHDALPCDPRSIFGIRHWPLICLRPGPEVSGDAPRVGVRPHE